MQYNYVSQPASPAQARLSTSPTLWIIQVEIVQIRKVIWRLFASSLMQYLNDSPVADRYISFLKKKKHNYDDVTVTLLPLPLPVM